MGTFRAIGILALLAVACQKRDRGATPNATPPPGDDAAGAAGAPADAAGAPADPGALDAWARCDGDHAFPFGRFTLPAGFCFERTGEGDDLGGVLYDGEHRVRMRYFELAHGAQVGDACRPRPERRSVRTETSGNVRFSICDFSDGRQCFSFGGQANLCTEGSVTDGFSPLELVRSVHP